MMLTRSQKVRLGAFMLTGTVLMVGSALTLAGLRVWETRDVYSVRFVESVSGLEPSATVKYQGLRVGRVESMHIAPDAPESIEVVLSLEPGTPIHEGTQVIMDTSGLTGLKTINLTGGDPRKPRVPPGSRLPSGESFMDRVTGKAEQVVVKAEVIANQLARWTSDENRQRVEMLIDNVGKLAGDFDQTVIASKDPLVDALEAVASVSKKTDALESEAMRTLSSLRGELERTGAATRKALAEIERTARDVDGKQVTAAVASARRAMASLDQRLSKQELGTAIEDLRTTLRDTAKLLQELDLMVRAGREDFVASLSYIRQAAEDLREFSRIIAQDPSVLVRGREINE